MALKTYVLLDHLRPTAPMYTQVSPTEKIKFDTLPQWKPYLQVTFVDESETVTDFNPQSDTFGKKIKNLKKGQNRTIRLKLNSNTPYQDEQIEKEKIPANEKFTQAEYDAAKFTDNVLATTNPAVQRYLEVYPGFEDFKGSCVDVTRPEFKLYDKSIEIVSENIGFKKRLAAANRIAATDLKEAQDMLIRIFGSFYTVPDTLEAAQNALVNYMDGSDDAVDDILKTDTNLDDEIQILLGRLVSEGKISFDAVENQVVKKKGNEWINLKEISSEHSQIERQRYFSEFLTSEAGKLLLDDLKKEAGVKATKKEKQLVNQ